MSATFKDTAVTCAVCMACGRPLPLGGVLDAQDRQVHYVCAELVKRRVQELARQTVKRMTSRGGR